MYVLIVKCQVYLFIIFRLTTQKQIFGSSIYILVTNRYFMLVKRLCWSLRSIELTIIQKKKKILLIYRIYKGLMLLYILSINF